MLKLNLGCGQNLMPGYLNVDKFGQPDFHWDLEVFPWPWEDNSVAEIVLHHVLEHLGESSQTYLKIIQELYRISQPNASIVITVPHPRHDDFLTDPTHVRVVTLEGLALFSKAHNYEWKYLGFANSTLGLYLDVDFEIVESRMSLEEPWRSRHQANQLSEAELYQAIRQYNNVVKQTEIRLRVVKETLTQVQSRATGYFQQQRYPQAIALYQACIELQPENLTHYWQLGIAHLLAGDESRAQDIWCDTLLQDSPDAVDQVAQDLMQFLEAAALQQLSNDDLASAQSLVKQIFVFDPDYSLSPQLSPVLGSLE